MSLQHRQGLNSQRDSLIGQKDVIVHVDSDDARPIFVVTLCLLVPVLLRYHNRIVCCMQIIHVHPSPQRNTRDYCCYPGFAQYVNANTTGSHSIDCKLRFETMPATDKTEDSTDSWGFLFWAGGGDLDHRRKLSRSSIRFSGVSRSGNWPQGEEPSICQFRLF